MSGRAHPPSLPSLPWEPAAQQQPLQEGMGVTGMALVSGSDSMSPHNSQQVGKCDLLGEDGQVRGSPTFYPHVLTLLPRLCALRPSQEWGSGSPRREVPSGQGQQLIWLPLCACGPWGLGKWKGAGVSTGRTQTQHLGRPAGGQPLLPVPFRNNGNPQQAPGLSCAIGFLSVVVALATVVSS